MEKNYSSRLEKISDEEAFIQLVKNMHSVAEFLSHLTAWMNDAIVKIQTGGGILTDDVKENWIPVEELKQLGWINVKRAYERSFHMLLEILEVKDDSFLDKTYFDTDYKGNYPYRFLLDGLLRHNIYHLVSITVKYLHDRESINHSN